MTNDKASQPENLDAKAQKLLEEKESEARMRTYNGPMGKVLVLLLCVWTAFQLYFTTIGAISTINLRAIHCIFLLLFTFLLFPTYKNEKRVRSLPPLWDILLILLGTGSFGYLILNYERISIFGGRIDDFEVAIGGVALPVRQAIWRFLRSSSSPTTGSANICPAISGTTAFRWSVC